MRTLAGKVAIVNVASVSGYKPSDVGHAAYCASKHAVIGLANTAVIDYGQLGLRVNTVCPGYTRSEMVDPDSKEKAEIFRIPAKRHCQSTAAIVHYCIRPQSSDC